MLTLNTPARLMRQYLISEAAKENHLTTKYRGPCDMLLENGKDSVTGFNNVFKAEYKNHCYKYSHKAATHDNTISYVEGIAFDFVTKFVGDDRDFESYKFIKHGWCLKNKGIYDLTYKSKTGYAFYFGIKIPTHLIELFINVSGHYGVFWGPGKNWDFVEDILMKHKVIE